MDRFLGAHAVVALGVEGEVDQQDAVLLDDADQQHHADQAHDREVLAPGPEQCQCAEAGRRQGGDDRQRVDEALVEHAEDDVHRHQRRENQPGLARQRTLERLRGALEGAADGGGHAQFALGPFEDGHRVAKGHAGSEVERQVGGREHAVVADRQRSGTRRRDFRQCRQRNHLAAERGTQVEVVQALGLAALAGVQFENHLVLVGFGLEFADLALAEGVVERLVDVSGGQAEAGCSLAVDVDAGDAGAQLQVVGQVAEGRVGLEPLGQAFGPQVQRRTVVALEHVLVLAAARPGTEVDVLAGAQVQDDAGHLGQLRAQAVDELAGRDVAVSGVFEGDPEAAVGDGLVTAGDAHGMGERPYRRVGLDDFRQLQVLGDHVRVGDVGGGFAGAEHEAGVLHREEALGNGDVAGHRQRQAEAEDAEHQPLVGEGLVQ